MKTQIYKKQKTRMIRIGMLILGFAISFNCSFAQWTMIGSGPVFSLPHGLSDIGHVGNVVHVALTTNSSIDKVSVYQLSGSSWTLVGPAEFTNDSCSNLNFGSDGISPYVSFLSWGGPMGFPALEVKKFDGANWVNVGSTYADSIVMNHTAFEFDGTTPYILYMETNDLVNFGLSVKKFNGTNWEYVGTPILMGTSGTPKLAIHNSEVYIAFCADSSNKASVVKWDGSQWANFGPPSFSLTSNNSGDVDIKFHNDTAYVAFEGNSTPPTENLTLYKFNGTTWSTVGTPNFTPGDDASRVSLAFSGNIPLITYRDDSDSSKVSVMKYEYGLWNLMDIQGELGPQFSRMDIINDQPFVLTYNSTLNETKVYGYQGAVSVEDLINEDQVSVFPNPTTKYITIAELNKIENLRELSLVNLSGQIVYSQKLSTDQSVSIDCSNLLPGSYFLRLISDNSMITKQIIIQ